ncbi:MAG: peptide deformylase [Bacteroidota bacterium]
MAVVEVIKMGNPILRKVSEEVGLDKISSIEIQTLIDDLIDTMHHFEGAGIAAPQIGILKRVFVIGLQSGNSRYPNKDPFDLLTVVNPEIETINDEEIDSWEGCLSIPDIRGKLKRKKQVLLKGYDRDGQPFDRRLEGFAAIVAQHELDHLDGKLFIDQMKSMESLSFWEEYQKYWM